MNDRFKFRATFSVSYYDENGNDKDIKLTIYDVAVYSGGEIGFSAQQIETIINALELPEIEQDSIWQFINDNYATSSYEWFVCDSAIIDQCTGLSDKNRKLTYENDLIKTANYKTGLPEIYVVKWCDECGLYQLESTQSDQIIDMYRAEKGIICGNIHEQTEQKDKE